MDTLRAALATLRMFIERCRAELERWLWAENDAAMAARGVTVTRLGRLGLGREYHGHGGTRRPQMWTEADDATARGPLGTFRVVR